MCCRQNIFFPWHIYVSVNCSHSFFCHSVYHFESLDQTQIHWFFSFVIDITTSIMTLAISSTVVLIFRLLVRMCNMIESGELSSKHPLTYVSCLLLLHQGLILQQQKILFSFWVSTSRYFSNWISYNGCLFSIYASFILWRFSII